MSTDKREPAASPSLIANNGENVLLNAKKHETATSPGSGHDDLDKEPVEKDDTCSSTSSLNGSTSLVESSEKSHTTNDDSSETPKAENGLAHGDVCSEDGTYNSQVSPPIVALDNQVQNRESVDKSSPRNSELEDSSCGEKYYALEGGNESPQCRVLETGEILVCKNNKDSSNSKGISPSKDHGDVNERLPVLRNRYNDELSHVPRTSYSAGPQPQHNNHIEEDGSRQGQQVSSNSTLPINRHMQHLDNNMPQYFQPTHGFTVSPRLSELPENHYMQDKRTKGYSESGFKLSPNPSQNSSVQDVTQMLGFRTSSQTMDLQPIQDKRGSPRSPNVKTQKHDPTSLERQNNVTTEESTSVLELLETLEKQHHKELLSQYERHQQKLSLIHQQMEPLDNTKIAQDTLQSTSVFIEANDDIAEIKYIDNGSPASSLKSEHTQYKDLPRTVCPVKTSPLQSPSSRATYSVEGTPSTLSFPTPTHSELDSSEKLLRRLKEQHQERIDSSSSKIEVISRQSNHSDTVISPNYDPNFASNLRVNLREKHARHLADMKAYYEQEIEELKSKLSAQVLYSPSRHSPIKRLQDDNRRLTLRCQQLEQALNQANEIIKELDFKLQNSERRMNDCSKRHESSQETIHMMQKQYDDLTDYCKEKEMVVRNLEVKIAELDSALTEAYRLQDLKANNLKKEHSMLQKIMKEYEVLGKEHEITKASLNLSENKLFDARKDVGELKRRETKLETELQRLARENDILRYKGPAVSLGFHNTPPVKKPLVSTSTPKETAHLRSPQTSPTRRTYPSENRGSGSRKWASPRSLTYDQQAMATPSSNHHMAQGDAPHIQTDNGSDEGSDSRPLSPILKAERELNKRKQKYLNNSLNKTISTHERLFGSANTSTESKQLNTDWMGRSVRSAPEGGQSNINHKSPVAVNKQSQNGVDKIDTKTVDTPKTTESLSDSHSTTPHSGGDISKSDSKRDEAKDSKRSNNPNLDSALSQMKSGSFVSRPAWEKHHIDEKQQNPIQQNRGCDSRTNENHIRVGKTIR